MDPVDIDDAELIRLPSPTRIVFAKDQPQYRPLPAIKLSGGSGRIISRWTLTADERARIAAGEDLYIEMLTFGAPPQPIRPAVGLRTICPADADVD